MIGPLPTPPQWRALLGTAFVKPGRVYQLADGTMVRADEAGHLDRVHQGGAPKPGAAWDPAPGRRG